MTRKLSLLTGVTLCLLLAAGTFAGDKHGDKAWFDMENCAMCANLAAEEGLMDNMSWETHLIGNGMLTVTTVNPDYEKAFARAHKNMESTGNKLMGGEQMELCGLCTSFGTLFMAGAKMENIETKTSHISLMTSDNPEVVAKIKAHAERTMEEMKAWDKADS